MSRKDGEQNMRSVKRITPGHVGRAVRGRTVPRTAGQLGECGPNSQIGETTVSVGVGNQPFTVSGGKFYLTGPYNGTGPCAVGKRVVRRSGSTFVVPAKAGPFDLSEYSEQPRPACDCVLVRGKIEVNPKPRRSRSSHEPAGAPDAIPTSIEGIPLEIQHINATTTRGNFQFNPTNCDKMEADGKIHSSEGGVDTLDVPFQVTNCADLKFEPKFAVSTQGKTSKANGAGLTLKVICPSAPGKH